MGEVHVIEVPNANVAAATATALIKAAVKAWDLKTIRMIRRRDKKIELLMQIKVLVFDHFYQTLIVSHEAKKTYIIPGDMLILVYYDGGGFWNAIAVKGSEDDLAALKEDLIYYNLAWSKVD